MNRSARSTIHVYRPVRPLEKPLIQGAIRDRFNSVAAAETLHATLLVGHDTKPLHRSVKLLRQDYIDTAKQSLELPVAGVTLVGNRADSVGLALRLDDKDGVLFTEHSYYREILGAPESNFMPHVTLGRLAVKHLGTYKGIVERIAERTPETVHLGPVNTAIDRPIKVRHTNLNRRVS